MFIIYPLLSIPGIMIEIARNKKYAYILLAIFMGYIGMLYTPAGDFYRYVLDFTSYKTESYDSIKSIIMSGNDFIQPMLFWIIAKLGMSSDATRFVYNLLGYLLLFSMVRKYTEKAPTNNSRFNLFIIVIMMVSFRLFLSRYGLSTILFVYGVFNIFEGKNKGWIYLVISFLHHFAFAVLFIVFVIFWIFRYKGNKYFTLILLISSFIFTSDILSPILESLAGSVPIVNHILYYVDGYYANEYLEDHSVRFRIMTMLSSFGYYSLLLFFYFSFRKSEYSGFIDTLLLLIVIVSPFQGICGRFILVAQIFLLLYFVRYISQNGYPGRHVKNYFIITSLLLLFINIWGARRELYLSNENRILLPSVFIWNAEFSNEWIDMNISSDGAPKVNF